MGRLSRTFGVLSLLLAAGPEIARSELISRTAFTTSGFKDKETLVGETLYGRSDMIGVFMSGGGYQTRRGLRCLGNFAWSDWFKGRYAAARDGFITSSSYDSGNRFGGVATLGLGLVNKNEVLNFDASGGFIGRRPVLSLDVSSNLRCLNMYDMSVVLGVGVTRYDGQNNLHVVVGLKEF